MYLDCSVIELQVMMRSDSLILESWLKRTTKAKSLSQNCMGLDSTTEQSENLLGCTNIPLIRIYNTALSRQGIEKLRQLLPQSIVEEY